MTLRVRLTLVSMLVLAIVITAFGGGVYILLNHTLHNNLDGQLRQQATNVLRDPFGTRSGPTITGVYIQFVGREGTIVSDTGVEVLPVDDRTRSYARGEHRGLFFKDIAIRRQGLPDLPMRVMVASVTDPSTGQQMGAIMAAASRLGINDTLRRLRLLLLWAGVIGLLLAGTLSWQAALAALRPVEDVAEAATQVGETGDLSRRVAQAGEDELGRLTTAFNGMLDRLEEAHTELKRTLEGQRRFVADASHELRTPLTTMRGNLEVLRANPSMAAKDRLSALSDAIEEGERMSRLVEDLLALARTDARAPLPATPVSLAEVTREAVELAATASSSSNGAAPKVSVTAEGEVLVLGSADLLRRLVTNLVENAMKFTPAAGHVNVAVSRADGWATLTVADSGIGMTPVELSHVYDRFWRADAARGERGSGLGMAIAKAVAEEHGGTISASSEPGVGTTFTVRLPVRASAS